MEDETGPAADSQLPYDTWMEESLRHVVVRALMHAAEHGLPGAHHFYVTFRTDFPGVSLPARLLQKYPQEMTIVLQHQFRDLLVEKDGSRFGVTLSFGGVLSALSLPLAAVSAFVDPSIQYGLRFKVQAPEIVPAPKVDAPAPAADKQEPAQQVVSLDAFRKRRE